jgi:hypothetical protein
MEHGQLLNEATDLVYANAVRLFDKDQDGALGFQNAEFVRLVFNLLERRDDLPGASDEDFNAGDRARKESALHIAGVIASHQGFRGQSGVTPSALRAATEAGVFQELTPVMQGWIEPAVKKLLLKLQQGDQGRRIVAAVRREQQQQPPPPRPGSVRFAQGTKPAPATPIIQRQGWGAAPEWPSFQFQLPAQQPPFQFQLLPQQQPQQLFQFQLPQQQQQQPLQGAPEQERYQNEQAMAAYYRAMAPNFHNMVLSVLGPSC